MGIYRQLMMISWVLNNGDLMGFYWESMGIFMGIDGDFFVGFNTISFIAVKGHSCGDSGTEISKFLYLDGP